MRANALVLCFMLVFAYVAQAQTDLRVPAGRSLTAVLEGLTSRITTSGGPRVVELQFGRREGGTFIPYAKDQSMSFEGRFLVRVRYDMEPAFDSTNVLLTWGSGESRQVPVRRTAANRAVFESGEMFFEDPRSCTGLRFCAQSEGMSYER